MVSMNSNDIKTWLHLFSCRLPISIYSLNLQPEARPSQRGEGSDLTQKTLGTMEHTREATSIPRDKRNSAGFTWICKAPCSYCLFFSSLKSLHVSRFHTFLHSKASYMSRHGFWRKMSNSVFFKEWVLCDLTTQSSAELCCSRHQFPITWLSTLVTLCFVPPHTTLAHCFWNKLESAGKQCIPVGINKSRNFNPSKTS